MPILLTLFYMKCIIRLVRIRPDICIAHQLDVLPTALIMRHLLPGTKVVFDNEDVYSLMISPDTPKKLHAIIRAVEFELASKADLCIFPNEAMKNYFSIHHVSQALVVPNIPENEFAANYRRSGKTSDRQSKTCSIVYFGLMTRYRGLENLIKAIALVNCQGVDVSCSLIGDGPLVKELIALASTTQGAHNTHFLGRIYREKIPEIVATFDAAAILNSAKDPMNWVGNPNKLYESMALGVPVIASNFGEIARIVKEANCGILVNPDNVADIAKAIKTLTTNTELRERFSVNAIKFMHNKYSWNSESAEFIAAVEKLVATSKEAA